MLAFGAGTFVFMMVVLFLSIVNAMFPVFSDDTILTIAIILGIVTATYNLMKK